MTGRWIQLLLLQLMLLGFTREAAATVRHALLIGSNYGFAEETVLEFAESDAARMAQTFIELGSVDAQRTRVVLGRPLDEIRAAVEQLGKQAGSDAELWLFISGHADTQGLHVQGELWGWKALRSALEALPARRVVAFVDACNSGTLLTAKGLEVDAPLRLSVQTSLRGRVLFASSGADELSYESRRLRGSPFAHFVSSGLRGPADLDRDGRITIAEVYGYVYSRTVAASLGGGAGPQHPQQAARFQGEGEWVLAERRLNAGELRQSDAGLGTCYVLDATESAVLAELRASDAAPVALPPRRYRVKCLNNAGAAAATVELTAGLTSVESLIFESIAEEVVLARGPAATPGLRVGVGAELWAVENAAPLAVALSLQRTHPDFAYELALAALHNQRLSARVALLGRVPWWQVGPSELQLGLALGYASSLSGTRAEALFGPVVQLEMPLLAQLQLQLREEILRSLPLNESGAAGLPLVTHLGVSWEVP
jgi:hypothetical protein